MDRLINQLRFNASAQDAQAGQPRWGTVQSYDPANAVAKVLIQPEGVLSGWLPVGTLVAGNKWGIVAPPEPGQQVLIIPDAGDHESGVVIAGTWNTQDRVPQVASAPGGSPNY